MHIITVTYEKEFSLLNLQALSINKFWTDEIDRISIISNSNNIEIIKEIEEIVLPNYGRFSSKVDIIKSSDYIPDFETPSWRSQQYLKLVVSAESKSRNILILDSKNHFIRPVSKKDFISEEGLSISYMEKHISLKKYLDACLEFLNYKGSYPQETLPCVTPYTVDASLVREVIYYCEKERGKKFIDIFFQENRMITEFFLIFAYLIEKDLLSSYFKIRNRSNFVTLFRVWPETQAKWDWAINRLNDNDVKAFGLHSGRVTKLSTEQRSEILNLWLKVGLFKNKENAYSMLNKIFLEAE